MGTTGQIRCGQAISNLISHFLLKFLKSPGLRIDNEQVIKQI